MNKMSLPDEWVEACQKSEDRLKDYIPIDAINPTLCLDSACPAAKIRSFPVPSGMMVQVYCTFSKCIHRLPEKRDLKLMK